MTRQGILKIPSSAFLLHSHVPNVCASEMLMTKDSGETRLKAAMSWQFSTFFITALMLFTVHCSLPIAAVAAEKKWQGVDESVVEKYAKEHGREPVKPLIDTDQGDVLLFAFLLAGTIGGFTAGYYWRVLMEQRSGSGKNREEKKQGDAPVH